MNQAPFDCSYTDVWVSPKNWETTTAKSSLNKSWYVQCYFHDPRFRDKYPNGKPVRMKLNKIPTLEKRKAAAKYYLDFWPELFTEKGWNPITKSFMVIPEPEPVRETFKIPGEITPETPFIEALEFALAKADIADTTHKQITQILLHFSTAAEILGYDSKPLKEIGRKDIRYIFDKLENMHGAFSGHKFNKYRAYLLILYSVLQQYEAAKKKVVRLISKRPQTKNIREILTEEQRFYVNKHLKENYRSFWIFTLIFFHSGGRVTEQLSIKAEDVDLKGQKYRVLIKKGKQYIWVKRVIKNIALPYWEEVMKTAQKGDFVFSVGLKPGKQQIRREQIIRRWKTHIKDKLGITADFYSLKHLNLDETTEMLSINDAAAMANHTTTKMIETVYAVGESERRNQRLRSLKNEFSKN